MSNLNAIAFMSDVRRSKQQKLNMERQFQRNQHVCIFAGEKKIRLLQDRIVKYRQKRTRFSILNIFNVFVIQANQSRGLRETRDSWFNREHACQVPEKRRREFCCSTPRHENGNCGSLRLRSLTHKWFWRDLYPITMLHHLFPRLSSSIIRPQYLRAFRILR